MGDWLSEIRQHANEDVRVYLVGNKNEMIESREIGEEESEKFKVDNGISYVFETSAKTGSNVEQLFTFVAKDLYLNAKGGGEKRRESVKQLD